MSNELFKNPPLAGVVAGVVAGGNGNNGNNGDNGAGDTSDASATQVTELDMLKSRAKLMGIQFSNNIGVDALKAKIEAKLTGEANPPAPGPENVGTPPDSNADAPETSRDPAPVITAGSGIEAPKPPAKPKSLRQQLMEEQMKLVRVRITNLDPKKKDLPGEIFTVANEYLGTVRKYIPYGEVTDNGYHIPFCLYTALKEREFLNIRTRKDKRTGTPIVESGYVREFALEVLPPLTEKELAQLAASQAAKGGLD